MEDQCLPPALRDITYEKERNKEVYSLLVQYVHNTDVFNTITACTHQLLLQDHLNKEPVLLSKTLTSTYLQN